MYKILELEDSFHDSKDETVSLLTNELSDSLVKTAGIADEIKEFLKMMRIIPGRSYLHINAVGAGEAWGANRNGDYFPEKTLIDYHKTYEHVTKDAEGRYTGNVFKHHINKNSLEAYGKVLFSYYNPRMKRVELIVELINDRAPDIVAQLENGVLPKVSMGMNTPYDQCSYCGNKAKRLDEYCDHLRYMMKRIMDDGTQVYAINPMAKFFDISFVGRPAWEAGAVLQKVASENDIILSSAELAENLLGKEANLEKESDIIKEGPHKYTVRERGMIDSLGDLSKEDCRKLSKVKLEDLFTTLRSNNSFVSPKSFQRIVLMKTAQENLMEELDNNNIVFNPYVPSGKKSNIIEGNLSDEVEDVIFNNLEKIAVDETNLMNRLINTVSNVYDLNKTATYSNDSRLSVIKELYAAGFKYFKSSKEGKVLSASKIMDGVKSIPKINESSNAQPLVHSNGIYGILTKDNPLIKFLTKSPFDLNMTANVMGRKIWKKLNTSSKELHKYAEMKENLNLDNEQNYLETYDFLLSLVYA